LYGGFGTRPWASIHRPPLNSINVFAENIYMSGTAKKVHPAHELDDIWETKREYPRFRTDLTAKIRMVGAPDWNTAKVVNLSKGGACVEINPMFENGALVEFSVTSNNSDQRLHEFMAKVVWVEGSHCGLQFITRL